MLIVLVWEKVFCFQCILSRSVKCVWVKIQMNEIISFLCPWMVLVDNQADRSFWDSPTHPGAVKWRGDRGWIIQKVRDHCKISFFPASPPTPVVQPVPCYSTAGFLFKSIWLVSHQIIRFSSCFTLFLLAIYLGQPQHSCTLLWLTKAWAGRYMVYVQAQIPLLYFSLPAESIFAVM